MRLRAFQVLLVAWIFPAERAQRRIPQYVYMLNLLASTLAGLTFVASHRATPAALKCSRVLPNDVQRHLLGVRRDPNALTAFLDLFHSWLRRPFPETCAHRGVEYAWMTQTEVYWGFLAERRERKPGLVSRFVEHERLLVCWQRRQVAANELDQDTAFRYRVFSVFPLHSVYFVPVFFGLASEEYNREQMSIRLLPSKTNVKGRGLQEGEKRPNRPARSWERKRAQAKIETAVQRACRLNFDNLLVRGAEEEEQKLLAPAWARMHYADLYQSVQSAKARTSGEIGPVNILDGHHSQLLVQFLVSLARKRIRFVPQGVPKTVWIRAANCVELMPKNRQRRATSLRLSGLLRRYGVVNRK